MGLAAPDPRDERAEHDGLSSRVGFSIGRCTPRVNMRDQFGGRASPPGVTALDVDGRQFLHGVKPQDSAWAMLAKGIRLVGAMFEASLHVER